jgi:hypothetical protein
MTTLSNTLWSENPYSASQNTAFLSVLMANQTLIESDNKASLIYDTVNDRKFFTFTYLGPVKDGCPGIFMPFQHTPYMRYLVSPARRTVLEMAKGVADVLESLLYANPVSVFPFLLILLQVYGCSNDVEGDKSRDAHNNYSPRPRGLPSRRASSTGSSRVASLADLDRADLTMVIHPMFPFSVKAANDRGGNSFGLNCAGQQSMYTYQQPLVF